MDKWVIMQELEDSNMPIPYLIVEGEEHAYELSDQLCEANPGFIFWPCACKEEEK